MCKIVKIDLYFQNKTGWWNEDYDNVKFEDWNNNSPAIVMGWCCQSIHFPWNGHFFHKTEKEEEYLILIL